MAITDRRGVTVDATDPAVKADPNPGLAIKAPVHAATTGSNIALSGLQTIDAVVLTAGDRVLVKDQDDPTTNGIYDASTGNWTRSVDMDGNEDVASGTQVLVNAGTINQNAVYILTVADPVVFGTSLLLFENSITPDISISFQFYGGGTSLGSKLWRPVEIPFRCTILKWVLEADRVGDLIVDVYSAAYGVVPTIANSIAGTDLPTLAAAQSAQSSALTGWSPTLLPDTYLFPFIRPGASVEDCTLALICSRP